MGIKTGPSFAWGSQHQVRTVVPIHLYLPPLAPGCHWDAYAFTPSSTPVRLGLLGQTFPSQPGPHLPSNLLFCVVPSPQLRQTRNNLESRSSASHGRLHDMSVLLHGNIRPSQQITTRLSLTVHPGKHTPYSLALQWSKKSSKKMQANRPRSI